MSKFSISKRLDLNNYKEGAYLEFNLLTFKEIKKLSELNITPDTTDPIEVSKALDKAIEVLQDKFVSGKLPSNSGELINVDKPDLKELPIEILNEAMVFLSGGPTKA